MPTPTPTPESVSLVFKVTFESTPEKPLNVFAYAFSTEGTLLASAKLEKGQVQLAVGSDAGKRVRVFLAPEPPDEAREQAVALETMARVGAYEPPWRFDPEQREYELLPIPDYLWKWWYWCRCRVRGQVVRPVTVGGVTYPMPVCNARVHVCEVDRLWRVIPRLPDEVIRRLRDELLAAIPRPFPIPEPDPQPFRFDPRVVDPSPMNVARMGKADIAVGQPSGAATDVTLNPQPLPPRTVLAELPLTTQAALASPSLPVVRAALLENLNLVRPWLCLWDWLWPYFYTCDEAAVLTTDHQGHFDTNIWYQCLGDHPDLYFWVEYCVGGVWTTVYHPGVRCHTYWNYACGSEVTLSVSDPRVPWCGSDPVLAGKQVAVLSVGHGVSMTEIQRQSATPNEGLTSDALPRPFGGSLEPHVWFGDGLTASGITHYRWSYRRLGSTDGWTALDHAVVRHYGEILADSTLVFKPFLLGPDPAFAGQNLFKIQPRDPPLNPGAVSSSWAPQVDARANSASGYFLSHLLEGGNATLAAGKYELKLELLKSVSGVMQPVNLSDDGVLLKVPTIDAPFGLGVVPTQLAAHYPAQASDMESRVIRDGLGKVVAFRLVLHVDNNPCQAEIMDVTVNGNAAGPCGFIQYTPGSNAHISFCARHPNDFATFAFHVTKGSSGTVAEASAGGWAGSPTVNGFARNSESMYSKEVAVATLLGDCTKAAFAETLHVDALATDGWSRLDYLDRDATTKAFALEL